MPVPDRLLIEQAAEEEEKRALEQADAPSDSDDTETPSSDDQSDDQAGNQDSSQSVDETTTEGAEQQETTQNDEVAALQAQIRQLETERQQADQRYRSLQGMFTSLTKQNENLQKTLDALRQGIEAQRPPKTPGEILGLSEEEAALMDADQLRVLAKAVEKAKPAAVESKPDQGDVQRKEAFVADLDDAIPNWGEIVTSDAFKSTLSQADADALDRAADLMISGPVIRRIQQFQAAQAKAVAAATPTKPTTTQDIMPKRSAAPQVTPKQPQKLSEDEYMAQCDALETKLRHKVISISEYEKAVKDLNRIYDQKLP